MGTEPSRGQSQPRRHLCYPEHQAFQAAMFGEEIEAGLYWGFSEDQTRVFICGFQRNLFIKPSVILPVPWAPLHICQTAICPHFCLASRELCD